jgi:exopolysaccharide biosynthesis WecB/TagA/CpsF family protein
LDLSLSEAVDRLDEAIMSAEHVKLAFCNAHTANLAAASAHYRTLLRGFSVLPDGIGVDIAARVLHRLPFKANLNGTDFIPSYLDATRHALRIALIGGRPGVSERAAAAIVARWPRHQVVLHHHGYLGTEESDRVMAATRDLGVDLLLVAMGNPRQEIFIAGKVTSEHATVAAGVGALFDFLSGEAKRAPFWVRRIRFEWAYRLIREPRRLFARYMLGNPLFLIRIARARLEGQS